MSRLTDFGIPTFALINGAAMGRRPGTGTALQLPHHQFRRGGHRAAGCFLGLVPGWGGAFLLPNLIGPEKALQVIVTNPLAQNRMLKPQQVLDLGIADAMFEPADFIEQSLAWAAGVVTGDITVSRAQVAHDESWDAAVEAVRSGIDAQLHGAARPAAGTRSGGRRQDDGCCDGFRRGGRSPRRPDHERPTARRSVLLRPGAEAGETPRRCT